MTQSNPIACQLVLYKGKPKDRVHLNRLGQRKVVDDPRVELRLDDVIAAINSLHEILRRHCQEISN